MIIVSVYLETIDADVRLAWLTGLDSRTKSGDLTIWPFKKAH
jgi:hypothetical protein